MTRKLAMTLLIVLILGGGLVMPATGYESAFAKTPTGVVEVKTLPRSKALAAGSDQAYFDENNRLFGVLFRYIQDHDVSMTVPVQAEIEPGRMLFFVGGADLEKDLPATERVDVVTIPERRVVSVGGRGGYTKKRFEAARDRAEGWIHEHPGYRSAGAAYAIYWDGPYLPGFLKRYEVHIPVTKAEVGAPNDKADAAEMPSR